MKLGGNWGWIFGDLQRGEKVNTIKIYFTHYEIFKKLKYYILLKIQTEDAAWQSCLIPSNKRQRLDYSVLFVFWRQFCMCPKCRPCWLYISSGCWIFFSELPIHPSGLSHWEACPILPIQSNFLQITIYIGYCYFSFI